MKLSNSWVNGKHFMRQRIGENKAWRWLAASCSPYARAIEIGIAASIIVIFQLVIIDFITPGILVPSAFSQINALPLAFKNLDFLPYYTTSQLIADGQIAHIYERAPQLQLQSIIHGKQLTDYMVFLYPPSTLLFFLPFSHCSFMQGLMLWQLGIAVTSLILVLLLCRYIFPPKTGHIVCASFALVYFEPWIITILMGQITIVLAIALLLCFRLLQERWVISATLLFLLTAFKPTLLIAPAIFFLCMVKKSDLWRVVIAAAFVLLSIHILMGSEIWLSYLKLLVHMSSQTDLLGTDIDSMPTLRTALVKLLGKGAIATVNWLSIIIWGAALLYATRLSWQVRAASARDRELAFSIILCISTLFSPWTHVHSLMLLVIPILYYYKYGNRTALYIVILFNCILWVGSFMLRDSLSVTAGQIILLGGLVHCFYRPAASTVVKP
ncbi:MAG: glycosyltransferase family 87 protein [Rickettsiales bacterium]|nr:glycosyltransferase family 87 protein [Rickettsiales bacterium]